MNESRAEFESLLAALLEGRVTPELHERLAEMLRAEPALRAEYVRQMRIDALLEFSAGLQAAPAALEPAHADSSPAIVDDQALSIETPSTATPSTAALPTSEAAKRASREPWQLSLRAAARALPFFLLGGPVRAADRWSTAAALLVSYAVFYGAFFSLLWSLRPQAVERDPRQVAELARLAAENVAHGVATLVDCRDCDWEDGQPPAPIGGRITIDQSLRLRSGQVLLRFDLGAEVGVVGPADVRPASGGRIILKRGQLAAHVPARACGFIVETRSARLIDLGTDFAVEVSESGETRMIVTRGAVEVAAFDQAEGERKNAKSPVRVTAGQAVTVSGMENKVTLDRAAKPPEWVKQLKLTKDLPASLIAYQTTTGAPGNNANIIWTVGLDFDVARPIRVDSLGVFDDLSDGIKADTKLTVQLWSRDDAGTPQDRTDDRGGSVLAELTFDASSQGDLMAGHRFKPLAEPLNLPTGSYTIVAQGFQAGDRFADFKFPDRVPLPSPRAVETWRHAIEHVGSRWGTKPGEFPLTVDTKRYCYVAGSFKFGLIEPVVEEKPSAK